MSRKKVIIFLIITLILGLNIRVEAAQVTCTDFKWTASDTWTNGGLGSYSSTTGAPTCSTSGSSHTQTKNDKCYVIFNCKYSRSWSKQTKQSCCCSGENKSYYTCPNTCGSSECATHTLSFKDPPKKMSHGDSSTLYVNLPTGKSGWTLSVTSGSSYVSKSGHTIKAVNTSGKCQDRQCW